MFAVLMVVTLGFYGFYLVPKLGLSVNRLIGKDNYEFNQVLWVGIFTCGLALPVYEVLFAYSLQNNSGYTIGKGRNRNIGGYVLVLNVIAAALFCVSEWLAFIIGFILSCWATWLLQNEVNQYVDMRRDETTTGAVTTSSP